MHNCNILYTKHRTNSQLKIYQLLLGYNNQKVPSLRKVVKSDVSC